MLLMYLGNARVRSIQVRIGSSYGRVSRILQVVSEWIDNRWCHLLDFHSAEKNLLSPERLLFYSEVNRRNGNPLEGCWGFVDGTLRPIAKPIRAQQNAYNGWKHFHALKYQFLSTPDGLFWVTAAVNGAVHDVHALKESGLVEWLRSHSWGPLPERQQLTIFGDSGYPYYHHINRPWGSTDLTRERSAWNFKMSQYRISVEWCIGSVSTLFPRLNNRQAQKTLLGAISREFHIACLLRNAMSCVSGNQTSQFFSVNPPKLKEYFVST